MKELNKLFKYFFSNPKDGKLEKKISGLLKKSLSTIEIFEEIRKSSNVDQLSRFLYNAGLYKRLLIFSIEHLEKNKPVSWPYLLKIFIKRKVKMDSKLKRILFHSWLKRKSNHSPALFACREWERQSVEFQNLYSVYIGDLEEKAYSEEKDLLEKLEFAKAKNLIKEQEELIARLVFINSGNEEYEKLNQDLEEKKALLILEQQESFKESSSVLLGFSELPEESYFKESWFQVVSLQAEKNPAQVKNLALFLYFFGWPDKALEILEKNIPRFSDYWFYLDWILETRNYTKGLELVNRLFKESGESETFVLPLLYIKSQILYGLGRKNEAIENLTAISQIQPNYKSVQYLLDKWLNRL